MSANRPFSPRPCDGVCLGATLTLPQKSININLDVILSLSLAICVFDVPNSQLPHPLPPTLLTPLYTQESSVFDGRLKFNKTETKYVKPPSETPISIIKPPLPLEKQTNSSEFVQFQLKVNLNKSRWGEMRHRPELNMNTQPQPGSIHWEKYPLTL